MQKHALKLALPLAALAAGGFDQPAHAGDLFLQVDGINGESTDPVHKGEIDVLAWSWGVVRPVDIGGGGSSIGKADLGELKVIKSFDAATADLILSAAIGGAIPQAVLTGTRPDPFGKSIDYLTVTLDNVFVTKVAMGGKQSEEGVAETVTFNFERIQFDYKIIDGSGKVVGTKTACYDVALGKKC